MAKLGQEDRTHGSHGAVFLGWVLVLWGADTALWGVGTPWHCPSMAAPPVSGGMLGLSQETQAHTVRPMLSAGLWRVR